jgi:RNA polymerase sigma-70 factor, ECF subfamily
VGERGTAATRANTTESRLVQRLKAGDENVFAEVVDRFTPSMLRVARGYGLGVAAAEDTVQEAWVRVLASLDGFEGRSSFRTWLFVILGNCARRRAATERRSVSLDSAGSAPEPAVDDSRFFPADHPRWAGMWTTLVDPWDSVPDERLLAEETRKRFRAAIDALPARYTVVFVLRDVEGWPSEDVCALLGLTPENQRVLLHRARSRIRAALEEYLEDQGR